MMNANSGTARTNAANSRWSCATDQMATRLPTTGKVRYSASSYSFALALASVSAFSSASPAARGVEATVAARAPQGSLYSRRISHEAIWTTAPNSTRTRTGPRRNCSLRVIAARPSLDVQRLFQRRRRRPAGRRGPNGGGSWSGGGRLSGGGRAGGACQPILLHHSHVRDDCPAVRGRDRPAVPGHQSYPVRDDVEDLPVRVLQDLVLVEGGGGNVASLKQNPLAVP